MRVTNSPGQTYCQTDSVITHDTHKAVLSALYNAIRADDNYALERLLSEHPTFDLRVALKGFSPPLHLAVNLCGEDVVQTLLNHGAGCPEILDASPFSEGSVLGAACILRGGSIVKMLIDAGADVNQADALTDVTPLIWAARANNLQAITLLCEAGANLEATDHEGHTALIGAVTMGNEIAVNVLLQNGATIDGAHPKGTTMFVAVAKSQVSALRTLISFGAEVNVKSQITGLTLLMHAAGSSSSAEMVKILLDAGADITAKDYRGYSALMVAAEVNDVAMIRALSTYPGIEVDQKSHHKLAAFDAADSDNYRSAADSLERRAPTRGIFLCSETALMIAARNGNPQAVEALLDLNARVNARNDQGYTVLMLAAGSGVSESVVVLCARGANPNLSQGKGLTALALAVHCNSLTVVEALLAGGANVNQRIDENDSTALMLAVWKKSDAIISALQRAGANLDALDRSGYSALTLAVQFPDSAACRTLLELGANPNVGDTAVFRPLTVAAELGDVDIVSRLIDAHAHVNFSDASGFTALMAAARCNRVDVVKRLIDAGANIWATTTTGLTAKYYATRFGAQDVVEILSASGDGGTVPKRRIGMA